MIETNIPQDDEMVSCETCLKEIPTSAAKSDEASEYFHYFCGLDCYQQWQEKNKQEEKESQNHQNV